MRSFTERFTAADCADCWENPHAVVRLGTDSVVLDWIVPSDSGDEAALSAAAIRDASSRLGELGMAVAKNQKVRTSFVRSSGGTPLRVAHGLAVNAYIGTSIELTRHLQTFTPLTAYLLLVERIPKGTANTPIERFLVRNMLQESLTLAALSGKPVLISRRPMSIPAGVNPDNLGVVGWLQDSKGKILAAVQSRCSTPP